MTRERLYHEDVHYVRECLRQAHEAAMKIHELERSLIEQLEIIDRKRMYVRLGHNSLRGFCQNGLKFTRRQSQSLESSVREYRIAVNFGV